MTAALLAADTPPTPDDGLPPGQPYVSPDDLASIPPLFQAAAEQALLPLVAQIWTESAGTVHAQLVDAADLPNLPPVSSLAAETYLAQAANTFAQVGDDLWNTARSELLAGFQAGESIPQLSDRLRNSAGLTARKATLVARTQVLDASNAGSYATAQASGLELKKGWLDTPDARTRPTHRAAGAAYGSDEQMIPLADQFIVGGYSCDRPHDPTLPPAERYSCRCALIYSMGPAAVQTAQDEAAPPAPLPNTSGQPELAPVLPIEVTPAEAAAAQAAKISEAVGSPPVTRQLAAQAQLTPRAMADLDSVHIPGLGTPDGDAYLAAKNGASHAYYTPLGSHPSVYATAQASAENPLPAIWFNPHWHGNRMGVAVRKGLDSGWYSPAPAGLAPLERTLAHEYGHHVTNVLFEAPDFTGHANMHGAIAERILGPINDALGANRYSTFARNGDLLEAVHWGFAEDPHFSVAGQLLDHWVRQNKDLITAKVSGYAAKNFDEFLAEVWQEYSTMGAGARPHIQTIGVLLRDVTEELRAGGGTLRTAVEGAQLAESPLSARTVIQLRALAKEQGIVGYSKLTKPQLVERLSRSPEPGTAIRLAKARPGSTIGDVELGPTRLQEALGEAPLIKRPIGEFVQRAYDGPDGIVVVGGRPLPAGFESNLPDIRRGRFQLRPGLTADQSRALDRYALSRVADPLNTALRRGETSNFGSARIVDQVVDLDEEAALLDSAIAAGGLARDAELYRGALMRPTDIGKLQVGAVTAESGYLSTTSQIENAFEIINWRKATAPPGRSKVLFRILAPKGTPAGAGHVAEREVLLARGRRLRVVEVRRPTRPGDVRTITLEILPDQLPAVVEVPLAKRRITELRTLAKQRGLTVPPRATKADLVKVLEAPPKTAVEQAAEANAAKRAAARERNKLIESRAAAEQTLAELDDLLVKKASREAFEQRIALAQLDAKDLAALRAALDDPAKLRAQVTRISKKQGITVTGRAGAKVKFDPAVHDPVGEVPSLGTPMVVIRRGTTVTVDGDTILLNKAVVKLPTTPVKAVKKAAAKRPPMVKEPLGRDLTKDHAAVARAYRAGKEGGEWGRGSGLRGSQHGGRFEAEAGGYQAHLTLAKQLGFDAKPRVLSGEKGFAEFDRLEQRGWTPLYRGWGWGDAGTGKTGKNLADQYLYGDLHVGGGLGLGTNMTNSFDLAFYYQGGTRYAPNPRGQTLSFLLKPDAKVIRYPDAVRMRDEYLAALPRGAKYQAERKVFEDPGTFAMARGYDAMVADHAEAMIVKEGTEEWIIFNRGAIVGYDENPFGAADFARWGAGARGIDLLREASEFGYVIPNAGMGARSAELARERLQELDSLVEAGYFSKKGTTYTITKAGRAHLAGKD